MIKKLSGLIFILFFGLTVVHGQNDCSYKKIIEKIDSISINKGIEKGVVKVNRVTSRFEDVITDAEDLTKIENFEFDGQFLVIEGKYFHLEKLLYFYIQDIQEKYLVFYFQGY